MQVPELQTFVFVVPGGFVKNGDERSVVLNDIARLVVDARRGKHATLVFAHRGRPLVRMLNSGWRRARVRAGLPNVRVHDIKHTFGRRLSAAGVSFEDRQDLLGHRSERMTTHDSAAELGRLIGARNRVCGRDGSRPDLASVVEADGEVVIPTKSPHRNVVWGWGVGVSPRFDWLRLLDSNQRPAD